jgi:hypothetical protein
MNRRNAYYSEGGNRHPKNERQTAIQGDFMNRFSKHDVIVFSYQNKRHVGFLEKLTPRSIKIAYVDGGQLMNLTSTSSLKFDLDRVLSSLDAEPRTNETIPEKLQNFIDKASRAPAKVSKGDIVAFEHDGQSCTGRVLKGGANPQVSLNATHFLTIGASHLSPATLPEVPGPLGEWSLDSYTIPQGPHFDAPPYRAKVYYRGQHVLWAGNDGHGGPDYVVATKKAFIPMEKKLEDTISQYLEDAGISKRGELLMSWVEWEWKVRPTGMSFADYMRR